MYGVVFKGGTNAAGVEWRVGPVVVCFKLQFRALVHFSNEPSKELADVFLRLRYSPVKGNKNIKLGILTNLNIVFDRVCLCVIETREIVKLVARALRNNLDRLLRKSSVLFPSSWDGFLGIYDRVMFSMDAFFLHSLPRVCHDRAALTLAHGKRSVRGVTEH
jgi:hypothetical protein